MSGSMQIVEKGEEYRGTGNTLFLRTHEETVRMSECPCPTSG